MKISYLFAAVALSKSSPLLLGATIAIIVAVLLIFGIAKFVQYLNSLKSSGAAGGYDRLDEKQLEDMISKKLDNVPVSEKETKAIVHSLTDVLNSELDRKVADISKEMNNKMEEVIKEKDKKYQVINTQYKETITDKKQTEAVIRKIT